MLNKYISTDKNKENKRTNLNPKKYIAFEVFLSFKCIFSPINFKKEVLKPRVAIIPVLVKNVNKKKKIPASLRGKFLAKRKVTRKFATVPNTLRKM